ncbi:MAG: type II toxin-antitoxin system PemK/MazF family toxin [Deinococcota bacterium]
MRKGDIYYVDFEPSRGAEANKRRPAVIVSNDRLNAATEREQYGVVTVAPITSNIRDVWEYQVFLPQLVSRLKRDSKIQVELLQSVAVERLVSRAVSRLPQEYLDDIDMAILTHFGLD